MSTAVVTERRIPTPRIWVGENPFPWPSAAALPSGSILVACYSLAAVQLLRTRQDKPYVKLQLTDAHGSMEGRIWDEAERFSEWLQPGLHIGVRARVEIFNGERQLKVEDAVPVEVAPEDLELFMPRSERDPETMERELRAFVASVRDASMRALLRRLLEPSSASGRAFRRAPAAKQNHHACLGGLLEHTLSVTGVCDALARHYGGAVDRDLLITAALLHDIGKIREIEPGPGFPYSNEGKLLGHILLGLEMVGEAASAIPIPRERLLLVQHLIASHQGRYEWQSPREPRILEGLLLHYADDLDAKMNQVQSLLATATGGWSVWSRSLGRDYLMHRPPPAPPPPTRKEGESGPVDRPLDLFGGG